MRNLCVYCGSSPGRRDDYVAAARAFARELVARDLGLVYGGASVGVMGAVADAVLAEGGRVTGVIPQALQEKELAHPGLTELHVTGSMHERKTRMAELADGFVAMPGGVGTLDEIFEVLALFQLRRVGSAHPVPFALMNYDGCFDSLIAFLEKDMVAYGSLREDELVPHWRACATNEEAMAYLREFYGAE